MSSYKYGMASFVEISKYKAKKHMLLREMYWSKEYSTLLYLWKYNHSNIIKYESGRYLDRVPPNQIVLASNYTTPIKKRYYELTFPRYPDTLANSPIYTDEGIIQVMIDLLSAITLCHKLNIWHRDIKPANIMVNDGRAILIDFTHAFRLRTKNIKLDKAVATYSHRAPEVFKYKRNTVTSYNEKIDVWALGVILFELVIDESLFTNITPEHTEDETDDFFNKSIPKKYMQSLRNIYQQKKRTLFHSQQYWEWIQEMLAYQPDMRSSAKKMLNNIIVFAKDNDIDFIMPTRRRVDNETKPEPIELSTDQTKLFYIVMKWIKLVHEEYWIHFDLTCMYDVYRMLIRSNTLNKSNKYHVAFATYILVTSVIYDNVVDLPDVIKLINEMDNRTAIIYEESLQTAMIKVMQNHEMDLFLRDNLKF